MNAPTLEDIYQEELGEPVWSHSDPGWRHGEYRTEVYKKTEEGLSTYWRITYNLSTCGETNGLAEKTCANPVQVYPHAVTRTEFKLTP